MLGNRRIPTFVVFGGEAVFDIFLDAEEAKKCSQSTGKPVYQAETYLGQLYYKPTTDADPPKAAKRRGKTKKAANRGK